jgi:hypothetical protein
LIKLHAQLALLFLRISSRSLSSLSRNTLAVIRTSFGASIACVVRQLVSRELNLSVNMGIS